MKKTLIAVALLSLFTTAAVAGNEHPPAPPADGNNSACTGISCNSQGGAGGAGGAGGSSTNVNANTAKGGDGGTGVGVGYGGTGVGGGATVVNTNNPHNTNESFNANVNKNRNDNTLIQGQQQGQEQRQQMQQGQRQANDSHNTAVSVSAADSHSSASQSQEATGGSATSTSSGGSGAAGNSKVTISGDSIKEAAKSAYVAPVTVIQSDSCSVGFAAGGQAIAFGFTFSGTNKDENCERLKLSRELRMAGKEYNAIADELLKQDPRVKAAFDAVEARGKPSKDQRVSNNVYEGKTLIETSYIVPVKGQ